MIQLTDIEKEVLALGSKLESLKQDAGWREILEHLKLWRGEALDELDEYLSKETYPAWQDVMVLCTRWHENAKLFRRLEGFIEGSIHDKKMLEKELNGNDEILPERAD